MRTPSLIDRFSTLGSGLRAILGLLLLGSIAGACSVPVFRYALEHWKPDTYVLFVFHEEPLDAERQEQLAGLSPTDLEGSPEINLRVQTVAVEGGRLVNREAVENSLAARVWEQQTAAELPHLVLTRPAAAGMGPEAVWSSSWQETELASLVDSPLRRTIGDQLLSGESVVWVLLESGVPDADEAAWAVLTAELQRLQGTLKLTPLDPADAAELTVPVESLRISFASHRLSRENSDEAVLREMLLSVEPDLRDPDLRRQPMAFPIFGRGRALYALIGEGIAPGTIEEACRFLTAGCQCTVKRQNPGVDLLFPLAWSRFIEPTESTPKMLPPLTGLAGFGVDADDASLAATGSPNATDSSSARTVANSPSEAQEASPDGSEESGEKSHSSTLPPSLRGTGLPAPHPQRTDEGRSIAGRSIGVVWMLFAVVAVGTLIWWVGAKR